MTQKKILKNWLLFISNLKNLSNEEASNELVKLADK